MAPRAGLDQESIINAAIELADTHGLHEVTMAMLASHLGIRTPTLYHYFDKLSGLRRALALRGFEELHTRASQVIMGKAGNEAIIALASALRAFAKEHPGLYEAAVQAPATDDDEWQAAGNRALEDVLRALSSYSLTQDDSLHAVRMLRSIVHGCVALENAGGFGLPLAVDETFRRLIDAFLRYLHDSMKGQQQ